MSQETWHDAPNAPDPPEPSAPSRGLLFFFGLSLTMFTLGGLFFGAVFLANVKTILAKTRGASVEVPGGPSIDLPRLPPLSLPSLPSGVPLSPSILLPAWSGDEPIGILLLGIDRRPDEPVEGTRTDTMLLVVVHPKTKAAAMISIPRDLWVQIPGYGQQRVNVAHAVGGPELAKRTVEQNLGVTVNYYARIDFEGFEAMIDTLGGVPVDVERPVKDDEYPTANYGYSRIYIAPGPQLLDGETALWYVRSRYGDIEGDIGRMRRQQRFLVAVRERALQLNMLPRVPSLIGLVQQSVATDLRPGEMLALARLGAEIPKENIKSLVLDTRYVQPYVSPEGADLLLPRPAAIRAAVQQLLSDIDQPAPATATIEVLNGTERAGLAQATADYLTAQGYRVVAVANADRSDYVESTITILAGNVRAGQALASTLNLPLSAVKEAEDGGQSNPPADLRLILGQSFVLPE